jgi:hypothetical protein
MLEEIHTHTCMYPLTLNQSVDQSRETYPHKYNDQLIFECAYVCVDTGVGAKQA